MQTPFCQPLFFRHWKHMEPDWLQIDCSLSVGRGLLRITQQSQDEAWKLHSEITKRRSGQTKTRFQGHLINQNQSEMWWSVASPSVFLFKWLSWYIDFLCLSFCVRFALLLLHFRHFRSQSSRSTVQSTTQLQPDKRTSNRNHIEPETRQWIQRPAICEAACNVPFVLQPSIQIR